MENQIQTSSLSLEGNSRLFNIGEILLVLIVPILPYVLMRPWANGDPIKSAMVIWTCYIVMFVMIWTGLKMRGETWSDFGLIFKSVSAKRALQIFGLSLIVFALGTGAFVLGSIVMGNFDGAPASADFSKYDYLQGNLGMLFISLASVYVVSSFAEEIIFRGFLITRIEEIGHKTKMATWIAVVLSAVIFGLIHFEWGPMGVVQTGFMGLAMAISYVWLKRKIWILVLAHMYMDTLLLVPLFLGQG